MKEHVDFGAANFRKYTEDIEKGKLKVFIMIKVDKGQNTRSVGVAK